MKTKKYKEKRYLNKLIENFINNLDIYFLYFIVAGLILQLGKLQVIETMGYFPLVPLLIYIYLLLKIFWFDISSNKER